MAPQNVTVIDPRMPPSDNTVDLAPRNGGFQDKTIVLFDNGKLTSSYGEYGALFDVISELLRNRFPGVRIDTYREDLLADGIERLDELASEIAARQPAGVILGYCDWGVTQPTTILAARLEEKGVPTSLLATEMGYSQAASIAARLIPGLPIVQLECLRSDTYERVGAEARSGFERVLDGLTLGTDFLRRRFLASPIPPFAVGEASGQLEMLAHNVNSTFTRHMALDGLGDGLPLIAPTVELVGELLQAGGVDGDTEVWPAIPPRTRPVSARDVAAVAVMAGCEPLWAPVVYAAFRAMADPEFRLFQAAITTHPGGTLVMVSGSGAVDLGLASGRGCLGPGFPANATIGRAVSLAYSFLLGAIPGGSDMTSQGSPAEYSYCCAENLSASPWPGLNADLGFGTETTVTVLKAEGPHCVIDHQSVDPARLLKTIASTMATLGGNNAYVPGAQTMVMLNPEHAMLLARAGWSKGDVQRYLFDIARNPRQELEGRGIVPIWPPWFDVLDRTPVVTCPEDILLVVVGGVGPNSQVVLPWGYSRAVTRQIPIG